MTPKQQAYEECSKICNEQLQASNGTIKWAKAVEMCQRLMIIAWLRGYAVKIENSDTALISDADSPARQADGWTESLASYDHDF